MIPISFLHLILPPLSPMDYGALSPLCKDLLEQLYRLLPSEFLRPGFIMSLMFDPDQHAFHSLQWLSAMFVHSNYNHLFSNLSSALSMGYPVYHELGGEIMYLLYFLGGYASFLPIHEFTKRDRNSRPDSEWKSYMEKYLKRKTLSCGSSGAVCSLLGSNFVILAMKVYESSMSFADRNRHRRTIKNGIISSNSCEEDDTIREGIFRNSLNCLSIAWYITGEWRNMMKAEETENALQLLFPKVLVGHSAHLKGFLVGAAVTSAIFVYRYRLRKLRRL